MKTIKIKDLLNKIANGEEVPTIIKYDGYIWKLREDLNDYWSDEEFLFLKGFDNYNINAKDFLNDEVEIIEEDKEIEKGIKLFKEYWKDIETAGINHREAELEYFNRLSKIVIELIDEVNKLKEDK